MNDIEIAGRKVGADHPPYVVAELSGNHNGDLGRAVALIEAAVQAQADAVKIQTYTPDTITLDSGRTEFLLKDGPWAGRTLYSLYEEAQTPLEWHPRLFEAALENGITLFSSPFDESHVDLLEELRNPCYKIASFEIVDIPLIEKAAGTGKPLIISTGMATIEEIDEAVAAARGAGCQELILLHCVSGYPSRPEEANLLTIGELSRRFDVVTGLSDHFLESAVSISAVALGACVIEKHLTLSRSDGGPDSHFSLEPEEFGELVTGCRSAWEARGNIDFAVNPSEAASIGLRPSLFATAEIHAGETFTDSNVRSLRPSGGLPPKELPNVIGKAARTDIERGTPLSWDLIDG